MKVTSPGIMRVTRQTKNSVRFNGKRRNAKA